MQVIDLSSAIANATSPKYDGGYLTGNRPEAPNPYQFPIGYFTPAVMPMTVVRPRPNSEVVGIFSYDHNAYVGFEQRIKIVIQGGAYPFYIENATLPAGATLGGSVEEMDYLVFRYTPTANGTQNVSFDIVDQEGVRKTISWTINVNTNWLKFVATDGNDTTGDGSVGNPWATITKAFASTTGGRGLMLRDGTHSLSGGSKSLGATTINSIFGETERIATIDGAACNAANGRHFYINSPHTFIGGISFQNPSTVGTDPRWFSDEGNYASNIFMDNCSFDIGGRLGTVNTDNVSCLFLGGNASDVTRRNYVAQTRCDFMHFAGAANGWSSIDYYATNYVVMEENAYMQQSSSTASAGVVWVKGAANKFTSIRRNYFYDEWAGSVVDLYMSNTTGADNVTGNIELCYCLIKGTDSAATGDTAVGVGRGSQNGARLPVWSYRNTVIGRYAIFARSYTMTFTSDSDIVIHNHTNSDPHKIYVLSENDAWNVYRPLSYSSTLTASVLRYECHAANATGILDVNCMLTGSYLTNYHGKRGFEIWKP